MTKPEELEPVLRITDIDEEVVPREVSVVENPETGKDVEQEGGSS